MKTTPITLFASLGALPGSGEETLPPLKAGKAPKPVEDLWEGLVIRIVMSVQFDWRMVVAACVLCVVSILANPERRI